MPPKKVPTKRKRQNNRMLPVYLIIAGVVLLVGVLIYLAISNPALDRSSTASDIPYPSMLRVSPTEAKAAFDAKTALFLDVRDTESYNVSHIPGAINIPLTALESRLSELPNKTQWIITYCT